MGDVEKQPELAPDNPAIPASEPAEAEVQRAQKFTGAGAKPPVSTGLVEAPPSPSDRAFGPATQRDARQHVSRPKPTWTRRQILEVQQCLEDIGVYFGADGEFNPQMESALDQRFGDAWRGWDSGRAQEEIMAIVHTGHATSGLKPAAPRAELPRGFDAALGTSNLELQHWIAKRSEGIHYPTILGPNMDASYYYRLGNIGTNGIGMEQTELAELREKVIRQGFPRMDQDELRLVNFTNYAARREGLPNARLAAKHFPGGDETLESTEREPVHFGDPAATKGWIADYERLIQSNAPPEIIMAGHASYDRKGFGLSDEQAAMPPALGTAKFEDVPASLNPVIIDYLRTKLGFKGLVISDWYNMGAIGAFLDAHPEIKIVGNRGLDVAILATVAGIDYITGFGQSDPEAVDGLIAANAARMPPEFADKLDASMRRIWSQLATNGQALDLGSLTAGDKLFLKMHNPKATYQLANDYLERQPAKRKVFEVFMCGAVGDYDVWNRTGIMTLVQRQLVVEKLAGRKFAPLPVTNPDEVRWFNQLMADHEFRRIYDSIDWSSAAAHEAYARTLEHNHPEFGPKPPPASQAPERTVE